MRLVIAFFGVTLSLLASTQALASSAIDDAAREFHAAAAAARAFDPTFDDISDQPWANGETRLWNAVEQWTCTWLKEAPGSSVAQFESALAALDKDLGVSGVRLSPKEMLLEINDGEVGNVFIVRTMGAETMIAWRISDAPLDRFPDLNGWRAARGRHPRCSEHDRDHCVPLFGWVGALPDAADGSKRFYIEGQYLAFAGATVGRQISVWRWKSGRAEPLTLRTYSAMIEQSGATRIQGSRLIVPAKTDWKTFFSCGSCEGRQIEQIFELRPTQVRYLGAKVEAPELDFLDGIFDRLYRNKDVSRLASPSARRLLTRQVRTQRQDELVRDCECATFGMFGSWSAEQIAGGTAFCLATDDLGIMRGRISKSGKTWRLTSAEIAPDSKGYGCP